MVAGGLLSGIGAWRAADGIRLFVAAGVHVLLQHRARRTVPRDGCIT